jgi:hypothetical protein
MNFTHLYLAIYAGAVHHNECVKWVSMVVSSRGHGSRSGYHHGIPKSGTSHAYIVIVGDVEGPINNRMVVITTLHDYIK